MIIKLTPDLLERLARGETVELIPAKEGHRIVVQEVDRVEGIIRFEYEKVEEAEE